MKKEEEEKEEDISIQTRSAKKGLEKTKEKKKKKTNSRRRSSGRFLLEERKKERKKWKKGPLPKMLFQTKGRPSKRLNGDTGRVCVEVWWGGGQTLAHQTPLTHSTFIRGTVKKETDQSMGR